VAIETQLRFAARQQGGGVSGTVRIMTIQTTILCRLMNDSGFLDSFFDLCMALETQLFSGGDKEIPILAGVGIVAVRAASFCDHFMDTGDLVGQQIVVTFEAYPFRFRVQEVPVAGSVRIVALGALSLGDGCMDIAELHFLLKCLMAGQTEVSPGTR
jgi:hypothetical protein